LTKIKSIKTLKATLWKLCSEYNRRKDADEDGIVKCCTCNTRQHWKKHDAGHYIPKTFEAMRFEDKDIHAQCKTCNWLNQGMEVEYKKFIIEKYGEETEQMLQIKKRNPVQWFPFMLEALITEYKDKIKEL